MAAEIPNHPSNHETPIVVSADSWTGGPAPAPRPSKFDAWANGHPAAFLSICVSVIALAKVGEYSQTHSLSVVGFGALVLLTVASICLIYGAAIGFVLSYAWFLHRLDPVTLRETQGFGRAYLALLLVVGYIAGLIFTPILASRLLSVFLRHL
jgi:hypothetical protein